MGLVLVMTISVLFAVLLVIAAGPATTWVDIGAVAAIAVGGTLLVSYVLLPLVSRLPNDISVMTDSFVIGRQRISFFDIEHAVAGTTVMGNRVFPVLSFTTRSGQQYLFGLSPKVMPQEIADFLGRVGISEPHA